MFFACIASNVDARYLCVAMNSSNLSDVSARFQATLTFTTGTLKDTHTTVL